MHFFEWQGLNYFCADVHHYLRLFHDGRELHRTVPLPHTTQGDLSDELLCASRVYPAVALDKKYLGTFVLLSTFGLVFLLSILVAAFQVIVL